MEIQDVYLFNGNHFLPYVNVPTFKKKIPTNFMIPLDEHTSMREIFENASKDERRSLRKLLFENILYSDLKHIYLYKINSPMTISNVNFKKSMNNIVKDMNNNQYFNGELASVISADKPFYLLDRIGSNSIGLKFIAGMDFEEEDNKIVKARVIFVEVVSRKEVPYYNVVGVEFNFKEKFFMLMSKWLSGVDKSNLDVEDSMHYDHSISSSIKRVLDKIVTPLGIKTSHDVEKDRKGIFELCQSLDNELLSEFRDIVSQKIDDQLKTSTEVLFESLFEDSEKKVSVFEKENYIKRSKALMLSSYITTTQSAAKIVAKAKELKLVGYTTRITFQTSKMSRGSTESASARKPIAASDLFHSLYINFQQALRLQLFSIAWFTDYNFKAPKDRDVIQTTIYAQANSFKIVFRARRLLEEDIIYHVVRNINEYRQY